MTAVITTPGQYIPPAQSMAPSLPHPPHTVLSFLPTSPSLPSEIAETIKSINYFNTYGGNALACAVSSAALDVSRMCTNLYIHTYVVAILVCFKQKQPSIICAWGSCDILHNSIRTSRKECHLWPMVLWFWFYSGTYLGMVIFVYTYVYYWKCGESCLATKIFYPTYPVWYTHSCSLC